METAKKGGLLDDEQAAKLVQNTITALKGKAPDHASPMEIDWVPSEADCAAKMAEFEQAGK